MYSFDDIIEIDNFLDEHIFSEVNFYTNQPKWAFGHVSSDESRNRPFWVMELLDNPYFTRKIFNIIKEKIGTNYEITRVYVNGQTFGLEGSPHIDSPLEDSYTFLVYTNLDWDLLWGGDTVFVNRYFDTKTDSEKYFDNENIIRTKKIIPTPNKALFFPSRIIHYAESPKRDFFGLRTTLAYKLIKV